MSDIAIRCEGLSKQYLIGERESYKALRDVITDAAAAPFRRLRSALRNGNGSSIRNPKSKIRNSPAELRNTFWALNDVSFEVKRGEVVGIIGSNGAGKSTLLKILSRITKPTRGHAEIHGRVGSLLEVGTGFHPELTGRENTYLNAAILGMRKAEVERKFDEIVAFAEVEKFIDTPVKRYSSGMYVRLAFAVAAHLDTEILLVDEVLAVGDAAFQKKCLGKLRDVSQGGRAVMFVSHNMGAIARLCPRGIWLADGKLVDDCAVSNVIFRYISSVASPTNSEANLEDRINFPPDAQARLLRACIRDLNGNPCNVFSVGDSVLIEFDVEYEHESSNFTHSVQIFNSDNTPLYNLWDADFLSEQPPAAKHRRIVVRIDDVSLYPDDYFVSLWVGDSGAQTVDTAANCLRFSMVQGDQTMRWRLTKDKGLVWKPAQWTYSNS